MTLPGFFPGTDMPDAGWWQALWPDPARVVRQAGVEPGMIVVDLCAGDGWFTAPIAELARSVIAIDIDARLLQVAAARCEKLGLSNLRFLQADAYDITTVLQEPVDLVFLANVFHGVPDKPRLVRAVRKVLRPGGSFAVVNWHARPREETMILGEPRGPASELRMTPEQTIAAATAGGLGFRKRVEVSPYHYVAIFERVD
jgi:ubiquinone/menaquinone biosynthesis C-methylase UbiE